MPKWIVSVKLKNGNTVAIPMDDLTSSLEWHLGDFTESDIQQVIITRGN